MVSDLYWVSALVYAIVLMIIFFNEIHLNRKPTNMEKHFRMMIMWVIFFCLQDVFWGLCENHRIGGDRVFFAASVIFHSSTVITTFFWLRYVLYFLEDRIKRKNVYLILDGVVIACQFTLLIVNFFHPTLFRIVDGVYQTEILRPLAFLNQYVVYVWIGILTLVGALRRFGQEKEHFITVFFFALAPILTGVFQLLYPDGPFYSTGYFLGCFIVYLFIVTQDRERAFRQDLLFKTNTDGLTGLNNRRAFEEDMAGRRDSIPEDDFVYLSLDVNGLKQLNDSKGHEAGDELLTGAANCIRQCFGSYGKIYRVGGDEFIGLLSVPEEQLQRICCDFEETTAKWKGRIVDSLAISCGVVSKKEAGNVTLHQMSVMAEKKMYEAKAEYYKKKGLDRRGQRDAHTALCALYTKILKINITKDTFQIVNMDPEEQNAAKGFSNKISAWLHDFGTNGLVHPDDLEQYLAHTDLEYLRAYFAQNKTSLGVFYRRKMGDGYKQVMLEMIPANDYLPDNQSLFLYVKNIDR